MNSTLLTAAAVAVLAAAGAASAQPADRGASRASLTLFEGPNFQGQSITIDRADPNLIPENWNDRARSARVNGNWRLCEDVQFNGHCETVNNDVRDLNQFRLSGAVSSVQPIVPSITFYELPNFQGRSVRMERSDGNLVPEGWNDLAQSARVDGSWRLCEDVNFGGRCETVTGDVRDLNQMRMGRAVSSVESLEPRQDGGGRGEGAGGHDQGGMGGPGRGDGESWGAGWRDNRSVQGRYTVFYPRPTLNGVDVMAGRNSAQAFCRRMGMGDAVYSESTERAVRVTDPMLGRFTENAPALRDVLCRKR